MYTKRNLKNEVDSLWQYIQKMEQRLREDVAANRQELATTKQLQCAAKGHNFVFEKNKYVYHLRPPYREYIYQFKCTNCGLTITKTIDELITTEKRALKDLGILEEEKNENTKRN